MEIEQIRRLYGNMVYWRAVLVVRKVADFE